MLFEGIIEAPPDSRRGFNDVLTCVFFSCSRLRRSRTSSICSFHRHELAVRADLHHVVVHAADDKLIRAVKAESVVGRAQVGNVVLFKRFAQK